ncbi:MAG TPA: hypothetical protein VK612_10850 [Pyrinomonadaceae bacterium]|nr:hypothetical protein [Pyrinomonadaceae bacterium]
MKKIVQILPLFLLAAVLPAFVFSQKKTASNSATLHTATNWHIEPSLVFDTLCTLNVLSGDEFYVNYYKDEYARLEPALTPEARTALANLKRKIKDENKGIISAFLTLYFSATGDRTIDDMLRTLGDDTKMRASLKKTEYYNEPDWQLFQSVKPDLKTVFLFLKATKFEEYWKTNILPVVEHKIAEIRKDLPAYNVVARVEELLGIRLPTDELTVYILKYSQPHGIRITGLRFLTDASYPFKIVLRNAIHEPMHPPFSLATDSELRTALNSLQADEFLMDKVKNHDSSFGYNSFDGLIEEDCIQALEQIISEGFKVEVDARRRWKENDDGMHVFAVALCSVMKEENFDGKRENFRAFLIRMIGSGKLSAGRIKPIYDAFYAKPV